MPMELATFDRAAFLRDHWQQRPLLVRNPWSEWRNPLEPEELAGLACEPDVESRLVLATEGTWSLEHGPIPEQRFARLGDREWTLLVQAVDHHVPDVAALIEPFRFIPDWRIDDVMVSYAADGGGVGPHFDRYDVFLIQGQGRRRWRIGARCDESTPLLPHDDLRLLADFEATDEWILEPGDILYLPPGVAHDGIALGEDCMTYSIGFRAPSRRDLIGLWAEEAVAQLTPDDRYTDPGLQSQRNPGEISRKALARLQAMVAETLLDKNGFVRWFGRHCSARKYPEVDWRPDEAVTRADLRAALSEGAELERNPASRFAFIAGQPGSLLLFVDGQCYECHAEAAAFAETLCAQHRLIPDPQLRRSGPTLSLMAELINQGSLALCPGA
jgi:50S ribosomal protein L16 3-hydroxylase